MIVLMLRLSADLFAQEEKTLPSWAPEKGYSANTRHIFFPDYNFYYDLKEGLYIYLNGSSWTSSAKVPPKFAKANLKAATQIELDADTPTPQRFNPKHRIKYPAKKKS